MSLPDYSKLQSLAKKTTAEKEQLGLPTDGWFWSSSENSNSDGAYDMHFGNGATNSNAKYDWTNKVLCVGD